MSMEPTDPQSATILLVADEPWLYQAIREGLELSEVVRAASGVEYDRGTIAAENGVWNVVLAADRVSSGEALVADIKPLLVAILEGKTEEFAVQRTRDVIVSMFQTILTSETNGLRIPLPLALLQHADRFALRGSRSAGLNEAIFKFSQGENLVPPRFHSALKTFAVTKKTGFVVVRVTRHVYRKRTAFGQPSQTATPLYIDLPASVSSFFRSFFGSLPITVLQPSSSLTAPPTFDLTPAARTTSIKGTLRGFNLRSIRMFDAVSWPSPSCRAGWHVVLGDNASGKTSLLRALALSLLPRPEREALRQDWTSWLRRGAQRGLVEVSVAEEGATEHTLPLAMERAARNEKNLDAVVDVRSSERLEYGGFLAAYGPLRRFTGGDPEWLSTFRAHPRTQRVITLFEERAALSDALEWLKDLWVRAETVKPAPPEKSFLKKLLSFVNDTGFLPTGVALLAPDADGVWCRDGNGLRVLAIELSDGYRAALSLTLDLVRHLTVEHGHAKVFSKTKPTTVEAEGIVLIDEPDAHLHPTWQQRIGGWFKRFFPRMQFVVTTHSPIVCQAADSVLLLPSPGDDGPARMATPAELDRLRYGDVLDAFATDFFGRKVTRSEEGREKVRRLAELNVKAIQSGLDDAERAEQEALRGELGTVGDAPPVNPAS